VAGRMDAGPPENFISHPVAHAREIALVKEQGFDWFFTMPFKGVG